MPQRLSFVASVDCDIYAGSMMLVAGVLVLVGLAAFSFTARLGEEVGAEGGYGAGVAANEKGGYRAAP